MNFNVAKVAMSINNFNDNITTSNCYDKLIHKLARHDDEPR